jgi:hypothetical protein
LYYYLISRPAGDRVDLLALTQVERRRYIDTQWSTVIEEQKTLVYQMWKPIVSSIDLDAIFNPPAICTPAQTQHCAAIRHNLQVSFLLAIDSCIDIRVQFEVAVEARSTEPLLPNYPKIKSDYRGLMPSSPIGEICQP